MKNGEHKFASFLYDTVSVFISAIAVLTAVFTFAFRIVGVSGTSMLPTLQNNDWLIVTPYYGQVKSKDIVIITQPTYFDEPLVKRVIAVGGQTVDIDHEAGIVYVDGKALEEPYTLTLTTNKVEDEMTFPVTIPEGYVFCMGDNRNGSTDSRSNLVGLIKEDYLLGKARLRFLPSGSSNIYSTTPTAAADGE